MNPEAQTEVNPQAQTEEDPQYDIQLPDFADGIEMEEGIGDRER